jgi:hypothetical protein
MKVVNGQSKKRGYLINWRRHFRFATPPSVESHFRSVFSEEKSSITRKMRQIDEKCLLNTRWNYQLAMNFPLDSNIQCRFPFPINFSQQLNKLVIRKRFEIDEEGLRITNLKPRSDY